ncbi:MAG: methylated-DNA--[protein]-cysteine S-methyltransferase [Candidatus Cloacimonetes bacterium]|nr:methylated-DNA--[protein]-cysteine S-methyltransferase [Candidatus Cloacimonadota bacterium]
MQFKVILKTIVSSISLTFDDEFVTELSFINSNEVDSNSNRFIIVSEISESALFTQNFIKLSNIKKRIILNSLTQLEDYFSGRPVNFSIPVKYKTTSFCQKVFDTITKIPYGQTMTYKQIAQKMGNPGASRAVGNSLSSNKILIIIPCHRVVKSNGESGGYAGGINNKQLLLKLEIATKRHD